MSARDHLTVDYKIKPTHAPNVVFLCFFYLKKGTQRNVLFHIHISSVLKLFQHQHLSRSTGRTVQNTRGTGRLTPGPRAGITDTEGAPLQAQGGPAGPVASTNTHEQRREPLSWLLSGGRELSVLRHIPSPSTPEAASENHLLTYVIIPVPKIHCHIQEILLGMLFRFTIEFIQVLRIWLFSFSLLS